MLKEGSACGFIACFPARLDAAHSPAVSTVPEPAVRVRLGLDAPVPPAAVVVVAAAPMLAARVGGRLLLRRCFLGLLLSLGTAAWHSPPDWRKSRRGRAMGWMPSALPDDPAGASSSLAAILRMLQRFERRPADVELVVVDEPIHRKYSVPCRLSARRPWKPSKRTNEAVSLLPFSVRPRAFGEFAVG